MVYATAHVCIVIISVSFECIIDCIICMEYDLDISVLEKICEIYYHWVMVYEGDPFLGGWTVCYCVNVVKIFLSYLCIEFSPSPI